MPRPRIQNDTFVHATAADAYAHLRTLKTAGRTGKRFAVWEVTDSARPGLLLYVVERSAVNAMGRAARRWGVRSVEAAAPAAADHLRDEAERLLGQLPAAERVALLRRLSKRRKT